MCLSLYINCTTENQIWQECRCCLILDCDCNRFFWVVQEVLYPRQSRTWMSEFALAGQDFFNLKNRIISVNWFFDRVYRSLSNLKSRDWVTIGSFSNCQATVLASPCDWHDWFLRASFCCCCTILCSFVNKKTLNLCLPTTWFIY